MPYLLFAIFLIGIIYAPSLWVKYVIRKHNMHIAAMPGSGGELAMHFVERFNLEGVTVKKTEKDADYYSPEDKIIGLSPDVYDG